jgi:hypothetical protein
MKKTFLCLTLAINTAPCLAMDLAKSAKTINERDKQYWQYIAIRTALNLSNEGYLPHFPKGGLYLFSEAEEQSLQPQIFANRLASESIFQSIYAQVSSKDKLCIQTVRTALALPVTTEPRGFLGGLKCVNKKCLETDEEFETVKGNVERGETTLTKIVEAIITNK